MTPDAREIDKLEANWDLVDTLQETGHLKNLFGVLVDGERERLGLLYTDDTAEIIAFEEFDDGEFSILGLQYSSMEVDSE